jgi:hypothetical protein
VTLSKEESKYIRDHLAATAPLSVEVFKNARKPVPCLCDTRCTEAAVRVCQIFEVDEEYKASNTFGYSFALRLFRSLTSFWLVL